MKKIAICSPGYKPVPPVKGGAVETLINYLIEDNEKYKEYQIDLYSIYDKEIEDKTFEQTKLILVKSNPFLDFLCKIINLFFRIIKFNKVVLYFPYCFAKKIQKENYDAIIIENNMEMYKIIYRKNKNSNFIYHMHNNMYEPGKNKKNAKLIADTAKKVIFVSYALKKAFSLATGYNDGIVLHNVIDFNKYDVSLNKDKESIKNNLAIKEEINFLFTGRICKDKGVKELVEAFNIILSNNDNVSLTIIGFGFSEFKSKYEKKILKMISGRKIHAYNFMPYSDLIKYVVAADCIIIPSMYEEAFGVVALEAMAMKKAIIATNAGGLIESLDDSCALIIDRENIVNNLVLSIQNLIDNKRLLDNLGMNAYEKILNSKEFDKNYYYKNFFDIVDYEGKK